MAPLRGLRPANNALALLLASYGDVSSFYVGNDNDGTCKYCGLQVPLLARHTQRLCSTTADGCISHGSPGSSMLQVLQGQRRHLYYLEWAGASWHRSHGHSCMDPPGYVRFCPTPPLSATGAMACGLGSRVAMVMQAMFHVPVETFAFRFVKIVSNAVQGLPDIEGSSLHQHVCSP